VPRTITGSGTAGASFTAGKAGTVGSWTGADGGGLSADGNVAGACAGASAGWLGKTGWAGCADGGSGADCGDCAQPAKNSAKAKIPMRSSFIKAPRNGLRGHI